MICLFETFWGIGIILLPLVAHLFPSWRSIYLAISLPTVVYVLIWPWIPDSPRWHLRRNAINVTREILTNACHVNGRQYAMPYNLDNQLKLQAATCLKTSDTWNWWSLWSDRRSVITMVSLHTAWAVYVTNYNGMLLNIRAFGRESLVENTIAAGASEILGVLLAWLLVLRAPHHKWYLTGALNIVTGILSCVGFFIPETGKAYPMQLQYKKNEKKFHKIHFFFAAKTPIHLLIFLIQIKFLQFFLFVNLSSTGTNVRHMRHDGGNASKNGDDMFANGIGGRHR